ncbi:MAG: hypothetical protein AAFP03_09290 [Cyanobacteria bacterium J06598_3]
MQKVIVRRVIDSNEKKLTKKVEKEDSKKSEIKKSEIKKSPVTSATKPKVDSPCRIYVAQAIPISSGSPHKGEPEAP